MSETNTEIIQDLAQRVEQVIAEDIRPFIQADGGKIKLSRIEEGNVFVELSGACAHCPAVTLTLKGSVERILKRRIEEIKSVNLG